MDEQEKSDSSGSQDSPEKTEGQASAEGLPAEQQPTSQPSTDPAMPDQSLTGQPSVDQVSVEAGPTDQLPTSQPAIGQVSPEQVSPDQSSDQPIPGGEEEAVAAPKAPEEPPIDLTGIDRKSLLEAFLFLEDKPVTAEKLCAMLQCETREVRQLVEGLKQDFQTKGSGLQVNEIANGYILSTKSDLAPILKRYYDKKNRPSFSKSAIETLAIIAYKQPVTRLEIEEIRGAGIGNGLKILLERKLIRIAGRKAVVGHPLLYATTREFLLYFGLKNLESLPTIREIREMEIQ